MQLFLRADAVGSGLARPAVLLAASTVLQFMWELELDEVLQDGLDFVVYVDIIRFEQVGTGVPMESPMEPGRIGHRKAQGVLTIDVNYNEINMVHDRVTVEDPDKEMATSGDYARIFVERLEAAAERLIAWCDRKKVWLDRERYVQQWQAATEAAKAGDFRRPYEFTTRPKIRAALDACWTLVEDEPLESESYEQFGEAYMRVRESGWKDAKYEADPSQEPTRFGQPCKVSNYDANIATSQAPDATYGYSLV